MPAPARPIPLTVILTLAAMTAGFSVLTRSPAAEPSLPGGKDQTSTGTVTGQIADADGSTRADLVVCAQPTTGGIRTCSAPGATAAYTLTLTPGQYLISAHRASEPEREAFYTDRISCNTPDGCSGQPIVVNVGAGQTLEGIHPTDWTVN